MIWSVIIAVAVALVGFGGGLLHKSGRLDIPWVRRTTKTNSITGTKPKEMSDLTIKTIWAIGDLHGDAMCAKHWLNVTGLIGADGGWTDPRSKLVFVGDYVDKGPTSLETVQLVKSIEEKYDNVVALMGNHELEVLNDRLPPEQRKRYWYQLPYSTVHPDDMLSYAPESEITEDTHRALDILYDLALNEVYGKNKFRSIDFSPYGENSICNLIKEEGERRGVCWQGQGKEPKSCENKNFADRIPKKIFSQKNIFPKK